MIRVDEIEVVDQLVGEGVPGAVHHLHAEAVDESGLRDLERGDRRLRERMVGRVGGHIDRRQVEDERAGSVVQEDTGAVRVTHGFGHGQVARRDSEDQGQQRAMGHGAGNCNHAARVGATDPTALATVARP